MGDKTGIEWCEATWNPTTGCDKISPGCDNCYALTQAARLQSMGVANYQNDGDPKTSGPGFKLTMHEHMLDIPLRWRRPRMIFVNSMSDLFHEDVTDHFIARVFATMARAPQHTFQILTKRPQRMARLLNEVTVRDGMFEFGTFGLTAYMGVAGRWPLRNVWLGTSIESNRYAFRADRLRDTPAAVRFISAEPLLGPLPDLDLTDIDWLIIGAESQRGARPMQNEWAVDLVERCRKTGTAPFVKQLSGGVRPIKDITLFPGNLAIREYPQ